MYSLLAVLLLDLGFPPLLVLFQDLAVVLFFFALFFVIQLFQPTLLLLYALQAKLLCVGSVR